MNTLHIEWAPFTVKDGIDDATVIKAAEAIQKDFLSKQKGFIERELLRGDNKQWVDILHWASKEDAEQAAKNTAESSVCHTYFSLMANSDEHPSHFKQVKIWD